MRIKSKLIAAATLVCASAFAQQPVGVALIGTTATATGNGTTTAGTLRVTISSDSTGQVALAAGSAIIGAVTQSGGPWTLNLTQVNSAGLGTPVAYGSTPTGNAIGVNAFVTNALSASFAPSTSSAQATLAHHAVSSTSTYNTVKASAGNLYGLEAYNPNSSPCYVVFYNSTSPTIGTTTPVYTFGIQAGVTVPIPQSALAMANFSTGITYATTTTDGGSTVCSTGLSVDAQYF